MSFNFKDPDSAELWKTVVLTSVNTGTPAKKEAVIKMADHITGAYARRKAKLIKEMIERSPDYNGPGAKKKRGKEKEGDCVGKVPIGFQAGRKIEDNAEEQ